MVEQRSKARDISERATESIFNLGFNAGREAYKQESYSILSARDQRPVYCDTSARRDGGEHGRSDDRDGGVGARTCDQYKVG